MTALNSLAVTEADLLGHLGDAQAYLENARQQVALRAPGTMGTHVRGSSTNDQVSITKIIETLSPDDPLPSDAELHTLRAIRRAMQMGFHVAGQYRQRSGAASFESAHGLADAQKAELNEKMQTAAAVMLFTTARFILWDMRHLVEHNSFVGNIPAEFSELDLASPRSAVMAMMYYLGKHLEKEVNGSDDRLVAATFGFAQVVQEAVLNRVSGLKHTEPFSSVSYMLEDTEFSVDGFEAGTFSTASSVEFNRVNMEEIVGNADAKHFARRMVMRMLCYNLREQRNVYVELGGLSPVWMGYGKPGTGKSMLISATTTLFYDYCEQLGIPFTFSPLPDNIIDSYQGNSAKNMVAWMKAAHDPSRLVFMPIDDAENILEERTRKGVSEGVRAAIGVFLRYTEGAYAINRGNATIGIFTNLPEQIDAAVRSRIQGRMVIDGADSHEDFLDQDHLWLRKFEDQPGFNNLVLSEYEYMTAQRLLKSMADASQTHDEPQQQTVHDIYTDVAFKHDVQAHDFFAALYMAFMARFPTFSSRDVRNIHSAINQRIMDFDMPEEWFENPETFCDLSYDEQKAMVLDLRNQNMGGLSLSDIYRQEVIRYLDNYAAIADAQFDREVEERLEQVRIQQAVHRRADAKAA